MRYCMFCGEEMPEQAVFCPSCGAKQPVQEANSKQQKVEEDEEEGDDNNIALNILNKANFSSKSGTGKSIIPVVDNKPEKRAVRIETEPVKKEAEQVKYVEPLIDEENIKAYDEAPPIVFLDDDDDDDDLTDEQIRKKAELFSQMEHSQEYVPQILEEIKEEQREKQIEEKEKEIRQEIFDNREAAKLEKEESNTKTTQKKNEGELPPVPGDNSKPVKKPIYKKRNLSEEDESENEDAIPHTMKSTSSLILDDGDSDLTADEKADIEKHKKYKAEEDDDIALGEGRIKGEGRKKGGRKKEVRKNVDKEIAKRRINDIEHEEVSKKDDVDEDYDGYYENVKPIDFDKMRDNTAIVKTAITGAISIAVACTVFYILFTFFMQ